MNEALFLQFSPMPKWLTTHELTNATAHELNLDPYIEKIGPNLRTGGKEGGGSPRVGVRVTGAEGVASGLRTSVSWSGSLG